MILATWKGYTRISSTRILDDSHAYYFTFSSFLQQASLFMICHNKSELQLRIEHLLLYYNINEF